MSRIKCCLCGKVIKPNAFGWAGGNNPWPLKDSGQCCDDCNREKVIPARLQIAFKQEHISTMYGKEK